MIPGVIPINQGFKKNIIENPIIEKINESPKQLNFKDLNFEEKFEFIRNKRDKLIQETIWIKEKYECQLREKQIGISSGTDIPQKKFEEWLKYWKELRNIPNKIKSGELNIDNIVFPKQPN